MEFPETFPLSRVQAMEKKPFSLFCTNEEETRIAPSSYHSHVKQLSTMGLNKRIGFE